MLSTGWMGVPIPINRADGQLTGSVRPLGIRNGDTNNLLNLMAGLVTGFDWVDLFFTKPSDFVTALYWYPFEVGRFDKLESDVGDLKIGSFTNTNVQCCDIGINSQYYSLGEVLVSRFFNNFLDYNGYTKIEIFLPYYGFVSVNPNDVMGKYLEFRLKVDYMTGIGTYIIGVSNNPVPNANTITQILSATDIDDTHTRIIATYDCKIGYQIPYTSTELGTFITNTALNAIKSTASIITGSLPSGVSETTRTSIETNTSSSKGIEGGRLRTLGSSKSENTVTGESRSQFIPSTSSIVGRTFDSSINAISTLIPSHSGHSGTSSPFVYLSQVIKIIRYTPKLLNNTFPISSEFATLYGRPLGEIRTIGDITETSYIEVGAIHLHDFESATKTELDMIENLLHEGVIL